MKKVISLFLSLMMLFSITVGLDFSAYAKIYSGSCGDSINWSYNSDTTKLTISGNGDMYDYANNSNVPWATYASSITILEMSAGITNIGNYAFYGCSKLTGITLSDNLKKLGNYSFYGCAGIVNITLPSCLLSIGDYCFADCAAMVYCSISDELVDLGAGSFYGCKKLTSINLPNIKSIGERTFLCCTSLTDITLPANMNGDIGKYAFLGCTNLNSITIPNGISTIKQGAFSECASLVELEIPETVKKIEDGSYYGNSSGKTSFNVNGKQEDHHTGTFCNCTSLKRLIIPNSMETIGYSAFANCYNLEELHIPITTRYKNKPYGNSYSYDPFYNCTGIKSIIITCGAGLPQEYTPQYSSDTTSNTIYYKFTPWYISTALESITIEDGVERIGDYTFYELSRLTTIDIPNSVKFIGKGAFNGTGIYNDIDNWKNNALYIGKNLILVNTAVEGQFTIKAKTLTISNEAFNNCSKITKIVIPDSVTNIGNNAFIGCNSLEELTISENATNVGNDILIGCNNLKSFTMPSSLDCNSSAITDCSTIESITLTKGNGIIPDYTSGTYKNTPWYKSKNNLQEINISEGITRIGAYSFYNNPITEITIPKSVTEIGNCAFEDCDSLETVYFTGTQSEWNAIDFNEDNEYLTTANIVFDYIIPCKEHTKVIVSEAMEPTCSSVGYTEESYCSVCGHTISERTEIPMLDHTIETDEAVEPTCTKTGLTEGSHCSVCGAVIVAQETINANGHNYETVVIPSTCKEQGYTIYTCSVCGDSYKADFTDVTTSHDYKSVVTTPATCSSDGVKTFTCSICGDTYTEVIEKTGEHNYESVVTKPSTCTERGVNTFTCSVCGDKYISYISMKSHSAVVDAAVAPTCTKTGLTAGSHCRDCGAVITAQEVVNAKGHTYTCVVTAPTCKEQGYTTYTCSVCGDSYKGDFTAVTANHDYKSMVTTPATCTAKGVKTFTCSICGDKYTEDIEMKPHTAVTDKAVAATCTKSGLTEGSHCSVCGTVIVEQTVIPAKQHQYNSVVTAPTCRDKGYTTYTCSVCGDTYRADYTDKLTTHDYSSAITKQPTCSAEGVKTFTCSVCGDTYTEPVEKLAHTPATDAAVAPTGTSTGLTEGSHCSVCGEVLTAQQVVPALIPEGASVKVNGDKAVITLSDGSTITVPKDTKETVKNADGTYTVTLNDGSSVTVSSNTEINKTADGQLNVKATDNGKTTTVTVPSGSSVVKNGDNYKIVVVNGTQTVEKTVAAGETVVINNSGSMSCNGNHKYDKGVITIAPSYVADGVKTYTCTVCGNQKIEKLAKLPKKANTLTVKANKPSVKFAKLKKKNQTIALKKAMTVSNAQGTLTFKKSKGNKKITVAKNGKITVKKGLKKGTYKIKVKVTAAGNSTYKAATKTVTVTIKIK